MLLYVQKMNKFFIIIFIAFSLSACATNNAGYFDDGSGDNENVAFKIIAQGQHSNISLANQLVVKNKNDWLQLLKINGDTAILNSKNSKKLAVDFDDKIVIAVFAGQQPSGGYSVSISSIKRVNDNLLVSLKFSEPDNNASVTLALTQPYIMLATDRVDGKIVFLSDEGLNKK